MAKSSRARTRERKRQREQRRQRNRQIMIVGAIIVAAIVIGILFLLSNLPAEAPLPDGVQTQYDNLRRGFTDEGFPLLGNPDAPVSVVEYASFTCPACANFHDDVFPALLPRIARGEISFTYVPLSLGSLQNPEGANRAALCAGEQGMFWEMYDVLFHWHGLLGNSAFQGNRLSAGAEALGLNVNTFNQCFNSSRIGETLTRALEDEITGTPTIQINGTEVEPTLAAINAAIDSRLAGSTDFEPGTIGGSTLPGESAESTPDESQVESTEASDEGASPAPEETEEATEQSDESE